MWYVVEIDGIIVSQICTNNKADKYGKRKLFKTKKEAQQWIVRHTYKGMSWKYEVRKEN